MQNLLIGLLLGAALIILVDARDTLANHREGIESLEARLIPIEEAHLVEVGEN